MVGRQRCIGCERPLSVCLCSLLPSPPLQTRTCVVVLQHPHEARHKLSTLPILAKCLANCHVLQGRRFQAGCSPLLDFFFMHNSPSHHALLLFPTLSAQPVGAWFEHHQRHDCSCCASIPARPSISLLHLMKNGSLLQGRGSLSYLYSHSDSVIKPVGAASTCIRHDSRSLSQKAAGKGNYVAQALDSQVRQLNTSADVGKYATLDLDGHGTTPIRKLHDSIFPSQQDGTPIYSSQDTSCCPDKSGFPDLVLIAVDATWKHAKEMIRGSAPYLNKFAIPVCLPFDAHQEGAGMANSDLIIRKEPFKGCMTTLEAISSCLKVLEPNGVEIHDKLTCVLRSMVNFQASNITSHKVRMPQQKKSINCACYPPPLYENPGCSEACHSLT